MQKPKQFDNLKAVLTNGKIKCGAHPCVIKHCVEKLSKNGGNPMFVACLDLDSSDQNAGYFTRLANAKNLSFEKWPFQGTAYVITVNADGQPTDRLIKFIDAIERSNNCEVEWGDSMASSMVGKRIGVVYGECEVESFNTGLICIETRIVDYCDVNQVSTVPVPPLRHFKKSLSASAGNGQTIPEEQLKDLLKH